MATIRGSGKKRVWLSVVLSALLPGLGQIYNGFLGKGLMLLGLNFLITILNKDLVKQTMENNIANEDKPVFWAYMFAGLVLTVFAMIDAKIGAERINRKSSDN
ncbi:MAG: hypothetical protein GKS04_03905 [Candidatus Mycalebacterium zealandia]|nr:MAG: hypothetical protein GKS04_03905 [Candidatus Mycalebacterium zealandia]